MRPHDSMACHAPAITAESWVWELYNSETRRHPHRCLAAIAEAIEANALAVHHGHRLQPAEDLIVLADDKRKQRRLNSIRLAAEPAILVFTAIEIVGCEGNEALLRQARRKTVIIRVVSFNGLSRQATTSVLAYDHGSTLAGLQVLGKKQDPTGISLWSN